MSYIGNQLLSLFKQNTPKGRAYNVPDRGDLQKLQVALNESLEDAYINAQGLFDSLLPDNPNFTDGTVDPLDNDCNDWERRLGLKQWGVTTVGVTPTRLERMAAIAAKMGYPGNNAVRLTAEYMQEQLQAAGFMVFVYDNPLNRSPSEVFGVPTSLAYLDTFYLDEAYLGDEWADEGITVVANYIEEELDAMFDPGANWHGIFYIASTLTDVPAEVPLIRKAEFRQMILRLKAQHLAAFLNVVYV